MTQAPLFLGRTKTVAIDVTTDGSLVRFHLGFHESPQCAPIEFVVSAAQSMQIMAVLAALQAKHEWKIPASALN